jgi:Tol biopolymer transport system component
MKFVKVSFLFTVFISLVLAACNAPTQSTPQIQPQPLALTIVPTALVVYGGSDGSIDLEISGGTEPYRFVWSNGETTEDINNLEAGTYSVTVTDGNAQVKTASAIVSPPGKILFSLMYSGDDNGIYMMNSDGSNLHRLIKSSRTTIYGGSAWSPDSSKIAFYSHPNYSTTWSIFVMNSDGSDPMRLTNTPGVHEYSPTWSPDGSRIAFQRENSDGSEIWMMDTDGSNALQIGSTVGSGPEWTQHSNKIVFYSEHDGNLEIYTMNANGSNPRRLTDNTHSDFWPAWSPDGSQIAFVSDRNGNEAIWVMNSDGTQPRHLTRGGYFCTRPDWSPDGTRIAFVSIRSGSSEIWVIDADGANQTRLTYSDGGAIQPDWCP